jgi:SPP1 family predicted phage head-tail adaptor
MKAGRRDRKITIEKRNQATDGHGGEIASWEKRCDVFAAIYFGTGQELRVAAQEQALQSASFEVPANSHTRAIEMTDRILFDGGSWDVKSAVPLGRSDIRVTATRLVP